MLWHLSCLSRTCSKSRLAPSVLKHARRLHSSPLLDELVGRGFVQDVTRRDELAKALDTKPQTVYTGIDPTASSLHIGHLIPLLCLVHFHLRGHQVIPLIGSATGRIGDPSGRNTERQLQRIEQLNTNIAGLTRSVTAFFERALGHASSRLGGSNTDAGVNIKSNFDWHEKFSMIDFLQVVGVHARVNTMMNRESVKARLSSQQGLSFTEFTYQLLQAYDFYHLHKHHDCTIQVGGSDQWGNIIAGIELIGKLSPTAQSSTRSIEGNVPLVSSSKDDVFGITTPLLTTPSGEKFGKSAGNAVWLDENLTSVFDFYQYFLKSPDSVLPTYLKLFTFLPLRDIEELVQSHNASPELRVGQRTLAAEVTEMVHGALALDRAQTLTSLLFPSSLSTSSSNTSTSDYSSLTTALITSAFDSSDPRLVYIPQDELVESAPVVKLAKRCGLVLSNSAARSLVASRGLYLNNVPISNIQATITKGDLIDGRVAILRAGKDKLSVLVAQ